MRTRTLGWGGGVQRMVGVLDNGIDKAPIPFLTPVPLTHQFAMAVLVTCQIKLQLPLSQLVQFQPHFLPWKWGWQGGSSRGSAGIRGGPGKLFSPSPMHPSTRASNQSATTSAHLSSKGGGGCCEEEPDGTQMVRKWSRWLCIHIPIPLELCKGS